MKMKIKSIIAGLKTARAEKRSRMTGITGKSCSLLLACLLISLSAVFFLPAPVHAEPLVLTATLPAAQVNTNYYAVLTASGGAPPYTWALTGGALPPWLNLIPDTGVISGTPNTQGTFSFQVRVTDSASTSTQQVFYITVASPPLIFSTISLPGAEENTSYIAAMNVSGGTAPYTWSVVSGALPSGLTIDSTTGTISGVPARGTAGTSSFTIRLTDSSATPVSTQRSFAITVEKGSYQSTITIGTGLKAGETAILINGVQITSLQGGQAIQRSFDLDTSQTIRVEPVIQDPAEGGTRYKAENSSIMVTGYSPDARFDFYAEYYVEMKSLPSNLGQIAGSGWYREGYMLRTTAPGTVQNDGDPDTQYRFSSWTLPAGGQATGENLNRSINAPGVYTANYDTYYRLSFISPYGEQKESAWYKSGARAEWNLSVAQVPMTGVLGFFKGTFNAVNSRGTVLMDRPQNITVTWEPDYTMPLVLIPGTLLLAGLCLYGLYLLLRGPVNKPVPFYPVSQALPPIQPIIPQYNPAPPPVYFIPPPVYAIPPPPRPVLPPVNTTVLRPEPVTIRITDAERQESRNASRQKIIEAFEKLLDDYTREIAASRQNPYSPELNSANEGKRPALVDPHKLN